MNCHAGTNSQYVALNSPVPLYVYGTATQAVMADNKYPSSISIGLGASTYIFNNASWTVTYNFSLCLCDSAGNNKVKIGDYSLAGGRSITTPINANLVGGALHGKALYLIATGVDAQLTLRNRCQITIGESDYAYSITLNTATGGSCKISHTSAAPGTTITLTPTASAGYTYAGFTMNGTNYTGKTFAMPSGNATVTPRWTRNSYAITRATNPAGAGTVTADKTNAGYGDTVTVSQTPAVGYRFNGWTTSPGVTINASGKFSMPNGAITVTANYQRRSTGSLNKSTLTGGDTVRLTISTESTAYNHTYQLTFGSGMETAEVAVAAGTTAIDIQIPAAWSNRIPNATQKTGGKLILKTYTGSTQISTAYEITGLIFAVQASAVPTLTDIQTSIIRTVGGKTYADVGEYYVQSHSAVRIRTSAAGAAGSTITAVSMEMGGYSGSGYNRTQAQAALDFTSALLTTKGETTITVTATDSRGRTVTKTAQITVTEYTNPTGTLNVWRVDNMGEPDETGRHGQYVMTSAYSRIGTNSLTVTLSCSLGRATNPPSSGDLFDGNIRTFEETQEYVVTMTLEDAFETTVIEARLPSARYILFVDRGGKRLGIMKATTHSPTAAGKATTMEIAEDCEIYIGNQTLDEYIKSIIQETLSE